MNSKDWNSASLLSLMPLFTQTRKLKILLYYTSPVISESLKSIRLSTKKCYICKKWNRFFFVRWAVNPIELEGNLKEIKMSLIPSVHTLLTKELMESYNSFAFIENLQKLDFVTIQEANAINSSSTVHNNITIKDTKRKK